MLKKILSFSILALSLNTAFSQVYNSTQAHSSEVTDIEFLGDSVFSSGNDGFLIKWTDDDMGEHFQISDLQVKMIARNPNGNEVAVYETDEGSINRISVWNWKTHSRKFIVKIPYTVTSLEYSSKGTYLMCGTTSAEGAFILNASSGSVVKNKFKDGTGIVNFMTTSASENTAVMYSPAGTLTYYEMKSGSRKAKFITEGNLSQLSLFNKDLFLAGIKNGMIYVVQATSGRTISSANAANSILIDSGSKEDLFYITNGNGQFKIFKIASTSSKTVSSPELVRTFSGLKSGERIITAVFSGENIYAGTSKGNVYKFDFLQHERVDSIIPITENMYEHIFDIDSIGNDFYFLTADAIFKSEYETEAIEKMGTNQGYTNIVSYKNGAVLWSKGSRKSPVLVDFSSGTQKTLFNPTGIIQKLRIFGDAIIEVESNSSVIKYDLLSGTRATLYSGTSIQDAVLYNENDLYIAKTRSTTPNSPLIYVNIKTKETVPLALKGEIAYSLSTDFENQNPEIFGICLNSDQGGKLSTSIFSFNPQTKIAKTFMPISEEDGDAFTYLKSSVLYTNIGKSQLRSYNLMSKRDFSYKRSASMPLKVARNSSRVLVLNRDGSVSWYNSELANVLSDWRLTTDGNWIVF